MASIFSDHFMAGNARVNESGKTTFNRKSIGVANAAGLDTDSDLPGGRLDSRSFNDFQLARFRYLHCFVGLIRGELSKSREHERFLRTAVDGSHYVFGELCGLANRVLGCGRMWLASLAVESAGIAARAPPAWLFRHVEVRSNH